MRFPSLEDVATKWTLAHTVALVAWVVALLLGLQLLWRHVSGSYHGSSQLKVYAGENATFMYPANWQLHACEPGKPFIELPGTIKSTYKGRQAYGFTVIGTDSFECIKNRPEHFDIFPEVLAASYDPCAPGTSTSGTRLQNCLYMQIDEEGGKVKALRIMQNQCYAPNDAAILSFSFTDPEAKNGDTEKYGQPGVTKDVFLTSNQYKDIKTLAESIKY